MRCVTRTLRAAALWLAIASCSPAAPTPTATVPPSPGPTAPPFTPTATLNASLSEPLLVQDRLGRLAALGLIRNEGRTAVTDIELRVEFRASSGSLVHRGPVDPLLPYLGPGAASPIRAAYPAEPRPESAAFEVVGYQQFNGTAAQTEVRLLSALPSVEDGTRVVGELGTAEVGPLRVDGFTLAAVDTDGVPFLLSEAVTAPSYLEVGGRLPFEALLPGEVSLTSVQAYAAAARTTPRAPAPVDVDLTPGWKLNPQGRPFLVGVLTNTGSSPVRAQVLLAFRANGDLTRVVGLDAPIPLAAGEQRPFTVQALRQAGAADPTAATIEVITVPTGAAPPVEVLRVRVTNAETLGSNFFLRVQVSNDGSRTVESPWLFAALRSTDGTPLTATWHPLGEALTGGGSKSFVVPLPLADDIDIPMTEFDVRALGIAPE